MFERLTKLVRAEKVTLFIGAGFSIEAKAPSVRELCDAILSQLDTDQQREEHKDDSLANLSNYFVEDICCGSRNSLIELLQEKFTFTPAKMDDHEVLAKIPHFHNIFTTNYDTLLEDSYALTDRQVIRKDADCAYIDETKPVRIFKIHGDFVNQDFVVITSQDYKDYFRKRPNPLMWDFVKQEFLTKHILFIGYSLADDNIIQIIRYISKAVNRNQKEMYLIAPGINNSKRKSLKDLHVQYFDAYASDFFAELLADLKKNIVKDFQKHKVCAETFTKFCNLHDIDPDVSLKKGKDNQVVRFNPLNGKSLTHQINFTINNKSKAIFESGDFERYGVIVKDAPIPNVPYMRFRGADLLRANHSVNNIIVNDEIAEVLVGPSIDDLSLTISIPSRNFFEKVVAKKYNPKKNKAVIILDCHIYKLEMIAEAHNKTEQGTDLRFTFNFTFSETYTDNNKAIKWIDFIDAFYSAEDISINEIYAKPFNTGKIIEDSAQRYHQCKLYYENIKKIEMLGGVTFKTYNCCDEKNYITSCIIAAYLTQQPLVYSCPNGFKFSTEAKIAPNFLNEVDQGSCISIVSTEQEQQVYALNGENFTIPFTFIIFNSCIVESILQKDNGFMDIGFKYDKETYARVFSDKPVNEAYPQLTMLEGSNGLKEKQ